MCLHAPGGYSDKDREEEEEEEEEGRRWRGENTARVPVPGISHFSGGGFHSPVEGEALRETQAPYSTNDSPMDSMLNVSNKSCLSTNEAYYLNEESIAAMNKLAERIRAAREEAGLSQADVAKALCLSRSAVNQWEQGLSKNIRLSHFFTLARLLRQDPQWLATGQVFPRAREPVVMSPTPDYPSLTSEEKALLHQIRRLPGTLRKGLLKFLRALDNVAVSPDNPAR